MAMKKCPSCGMQFEGDMKFCTGCGAKLEEVEAIVQENEEAAGTDIKQAAATTAEKEAQSVNGGANPEVRPGVKPGKGRVIKLDGKTVTLGMSDGTIVEVLRADLGFRVNINDKIDIFTNNGKTIYAKADSDNVFVVKSKRNYNKLVYLLLAVIFGATGVHNLYAGNITLGAIWLIIFIILFLLSLLTGIGALIGIPAIIVMWLVAVIQGILGLLRSSDSN